MDISRGGVGVGVVCPPPEGHRATGGTGGVGQE